MKPTLLAMAALAVLASAGQHPAAAQDKDKFFYIRSRIDHTTNWYLSVKTDNTSLQLECEGQVPIRNQLWEVVKSPKNPGSVYFKNVGASESMRTDMVLRMMGVQGRLPAASLAKVWPNGREKPQDFHPNLRWTYPAPNGEAGEYIVIRSANPNEEQYLGVYPNDGSPFNTMAIGCHDGNGRSERVMHWTIVPYVPATTFNWKGELEFRFINQFEGRWDDGGTKAERVSFWHPIVPPGYHMVGDFGHLGRDNPSNSKVVVVVKGLTKGALAKPTTYKQTWADGRNRCSFWEPRAPAGYVAMGTVVQANNNMPSLDAVMCVRKDLVAKELWVRKAISGMTVTVERLATCESFELAWEERPKA